MASPSQGDGHHLCGVHPWGAVIQPPAWHAPCVPATTMQVPAQPGLHVAALGTIHTSSPWSPPGSACQVALRRGCQGAAAHGSSALHSFSWRVLKASFAVQLAASRVAGWKPKGSGPDRLSCTLAVPAAHCWFLRPVPPGAVVGGSLHVAVRFTVMVGAPGYSPQGGPPSRSALRQLRRTACSWALAALLKVTPWGRHGRQAPYHEPMLIPSPVAHSST